MSSRESTDGSLAGLWPWPSHFMNSFWLPCAQSSQRLSGLSLWVLWYQPLWMKALCKFSSWRASECACSSLHVVALGKTNGNPVNCTVLKCTGFLKAIFWIPFWSSTSEPVLWCPDKESKWVTPTIKDPWIERVHVRAAAWPYSVVGVRRPRGLRSDCKDVQSLHVEKQSEPELAGQTVQRECLPNDALC